MFYLYQGSDAFVKYFGAKDASDNSYLNSGACTYAIHANNNGAVGDAVVGASGALDYIAASNGNYRGVIDADTIDGLTLGSQYWVVITFTQGNYDDKRTLLATCAQRDR